MSVIQDAFYIPEDISTRLLTGEYKRIGSVVRYAVGPNKGRIVKHLNPVDLQTVEEAKSLGSKAVNILKNNKNGVIIGAIGTVTTGAGIWLWNHFKNKDSHLVCEFKKFFKIYIEAIRSGSLNMEIINNLMNILDALKQSKNYEKMNIQLSAEELDVMVGRIYEYTLKLAKDNNIELDKKELQTSDIKNKGNIIKLQNYLKAQKKVFKLAA